VLLYVNPVAGPVEIFRAAVLGRAMDVGGVALSACSCVVLLVVAITYFSRVERRFADLI
jgi:ABC-type polysaccharide/polyol phosphate export permease